MTSTVIHKTNFNVGVVSKRIRDRLDFDGRSGALQRAENCMLSFEGQGRRRSGSVFRHGYPGNALTVETIRSHRDAPWLYPWLGTDGEGDLLVTMFRRSYTYNGVYNPNKAYIAFMWSDGTFVTRDDPLQQFSWEQTIHGNVYSGSDDTPLLLETWNTRTLAEHISSGGQGRVRMRFAAPDDPLKAGEMLVIEEPRKPPAKGYEDNAIQRSFTSRAIGNIDWGGLVPGATLILTKTPLTGEQYYGRHTFIEDGTRKTLESLKGAVICPQVIPLYAEAALVSAGQAPNDDRGIAYSFKGNGQQESDFTHKRVLRLRVPGDEDIEQTDPTFRTAYELPEPNDFPLAWANNPRIGRVFELESPFNWEHVHATTDTPGMHVDQGRDEMTFTHPEYPIYRLIREKEREWKWVKHEFTPQVNAPLNVRLVGETAKPTDKASSLSTDVRSNAEGYAPSHAENIDIAVVAYTEQDGESFPGIAARDARIEEIPDYIIRAADTLAENDYIGYFGYKHFDNIGGLALRVTPTDAAKFRINEYVALTGTLGTDGIEGRRYRVKAVIGQQPGSRDNTINIQGAVDPQIKLPPGTQYRGPWVFLTPEPESHSYASSLQKLKTPNREQNEVRNDHTDHSAREGTDYTGEVGSDASGANKPWSRDC